MSFIVALFTRKEKYIVVYNPLEKKAYTDKPEHVNDGSFVVVDVTGYEMSVDLRVAVGPVSGKVQTKIATIDFAVFDSSVRHDRKQGKIHEVFVVGELPSGLDNIGETEE
ncbi:hypothetical protein BP5796_00767 [Coleophoma crateriformis]|uniref:Uncharacterized protein n=1 Tax=Coleophoma crateriformis TaxID=565419 RepID=A0A3D8T911_9HELO|nr:hypothetical protein BP5796_00767 [Coleophoma crateriformis]